MSVSQNEKQELLEKLNLLLKKQSQFQQEINELQLQITTLQIKDESEKVVTKKSEESKPVTFNSKETEDTEIDKYIKTVLSQKTISKEKNKSGISAELEKFIGENLINKIGIAVLIIGVGIGVKYAIDNDLISPLVRIILGYLVGFGLAGFAIRLKSKYMNFSAVLFSGAMTIQYFITYAAHSYYQLFPQLFAIILMVIITILTVALALYYKQQVIAHFGLVGAYIVPYLLKEPFINVTVLFIYMAIINSGILFISTKKKWKLLNYLAFLATWTIFISWFASKNYDNQLATCLIFLSIFFTVFYLVFLSYKLLLNEKLTIDDIVFFLLNSSLLYFVGYIALAAQETSSGFLGLFTATNAVVYGATSYLIYKIKLENKNLFYWTIGMVIAFITITVAVQFNSYITAILWSVEAALIFLYGKSRKIQLFEIISYIVILLTAIVTLLNWSSTTYNLYSSTIEKLYTPFLNMSFLASFIVLLSYGFIAFVNEKSNIKPKTSGQSNDFFNVVFPILFLFVAYFTFFNEIALYWSNIQVDTSFALNSEGIWEKQFDKLNSDISSYSSIWLINYSIFFVSALSFANFIRIKSKSFDAFLLVLNVFLIIIFLTAGLTQIAHLRLSYLATILPENYNVDIYHILIRYISIVFFALILYSTFRFVIAGFPNKIFSKLFEIILSTSIIWICSSELINWLNLSGSTEVYKHGLSILWGVFSLLLIGYGIRKKKKHLRISAIVFLGITLAKLFFYDLTNLKTVPKTIVFVSIGILLLIVSFLYNKYKNTIYTEN